MWRADIDRRTGGSEAAGAAAGAGLGSWGTGGVAASRLAALPSYLRDRRRPFLIAHRGASARLPENSLAAFRLALAEGADALETDLWFSADGVLVCHHDATVTRMTGAVGRVDGLSARELARLPLRGPDGHAGAEVPGGGRPGARPRSAEAAEGIPSLEALLALMPPDRLLVLELKDPRFAEPGWAARLVTLIAPRIAAGSVLVAAFQRRRLAAARAVEPRLALGQIAPKGLRPVRHADFLGPLWPVLLLNPWYVAAAQRRGQWVAPLDPGLHRRLRRYLRQGVDALLTADPAATRAQVEGLRG